MKRTIRSAFLLLAAGILALVAIGCSGDDKSSSTPAPVATATLTEARVREIAAEEINKASGNSALNQAQLKAMIDKSVADTMDFIKKVPLTEDQIRTFVKMMNSTAPALEPNAGNFPPVLHHDGDCAPELSKIGGCSLDVGVHDDQVGLAFGVTVDWPKGKKTDATGRCDLVILNPGWYEDLHLMDARFEVYTIGSDRAGWVKNLGEQRAKEQQGDYGCPAKSFGDIPQWTSPDKSPPPGVGFQGPTSTGVPQQAVTQNSPASSSGNAQAAPASSSCETVNCQERRPAGRFQAGEAIYGFSIKLDNGQTYSQCWADNTPSAGTVTDGVINPWKAEVASAKRCY